MADSAIRPYATTRLGVVSTILFDAPLKPGQQIRPRSPFGLVTLFRMYLFHKGDFTGPSVSTFWIPPYTSLELTQTQSTRTTREMTSEVEQESKQSREESETELGELADRLQRESASDSRFGVTASAQGGTGFFSASVSASASTSNSVKESTEQLRRHTRQKSRRVTEEIRERRSIKIRTSVETTSVDSRRFVVSNATAEVLNYQISQRIRDVRIQTQMIGKRIAWIFYVRNPGKELGVGELLHPSDEAAVRALAKERPEPPELATIKPEVVTLSYTLPENLKINKGATRNLNLSAQLAAELAARPELKTYRIVKAVMGDRADRLVVTALVDTQPLTVRLLGLGNTAPVRDEGDEFWGSFSVVVHLAPPQAAIDALNAERQKEYQEKLQLWMDERQALMRAAYVEAARERLKLSGQVAQRPEVALREEERDVVLRQAMRKLGQALPTQSGWGKAIMLFEAFQDMFLLDDLLYFAAPDWAFPRRAFKSRQDAGVEFDPTELKSSTMTWGGSQDDSTEPLGSLNYYVTEASPPAPLGASIGWKIQLDGDDHRNAFLNSPWVKVVIPIRRGHEDAAVKWLHTHGEADKGEDGTSFSQFQWDALAAFVKTLEPVEEETKREETVYRDGYTPLPGSFRYDDPNAGAEDKKLQQLGFVEEWTEYVPTNQTVAQVLR